MSDIENNLSKENTNTSGIAQTTPTMLGSSNIPEINLKKKNNDPPPIFICCGIFTIVGLVLGLIAAGICYYYYGIKFLIDYKNENSNCNSKIWDYVLVSLIISFLLGGSNAQNAKNQDFASKFWAGVIYALILLGIGVWGIVETENENCKEIRDTELWTFANVISIMQIIMSSLALILWCCIGFCVTQQ